MEESILREATVDDLDELVALWAHYVRGHQHNPAYRQLTKDALVHRRRAYAAYIERTDATVFVLACSDGGLDGMITCFVEDNVPYFQPGRYARVQTPFVRPGARRRGNLRRLLRAATRWAREEGMTEMRLWMSPETLAVLGAGTMGHGIAQIAALAGYHTHLFDVDGDALVRAVQRIDANLGKGVSLGKLDEALRQEALERISTHLDLDEAVDAAHFVIEAAPERLELKCDLLASVAARVPGDALLATNTSSLSISAIARAVPAPERVVGMHFFNPVHIMALLEIVRAETTSTETVDRALAVARRLGKTPIVVNDVPGFASSRLGIALGLEAIRMVEEGVASAADIDTAMELGYRHPMGPLRLTDLVGLDVRLDIARYLYHELGTARFEPPKLLERMVEEGKLGKKSGEGFYRWEE
jgi:3-hydroxybutyryl-CoA dehydrogenase